MDYTEKWGKDVDEAVRLALLDLNLTEDQVVVTVLEEPTKGFFGIGASLAKVRVEKISEKNSAAVEAEKQEPKKTEKKPNSHVRDYRKKDKPQEAKESQEKREPKKEFQNKKLKDTQISEKPDNLIIDEDNPAINFLKKMFGDMKLDVETESFKNDECFYIEVKGPDSRTVIGKRGQTLDSIQYITNLVVNKDLEDYIRVVIDVEGYRFRREKTLENLADKLARKAQKSGRSVRLEPMNPYERKVIHATLQGYEGITTRSEGEEPYRRVIIEKK